MATTTEPAGLKTAQSSSPPLLSIRNVAKSFGRTAVLRDISLQVAEGEFLTILGESGSGKTTLLRIIAGFENADSGEIIMGADRLDRLPPYRRRVNTVFQHYALFPHLTVAQNVGYGLKVAKQPKDEIDVLGDGQMWKQGIVLKHGIDSAAVGRQAVKPVSAHDYFSRV